MAPFQGTVSARASLPLAFRILLLHVEPIYVILGAFNAAFTPESFLSTMTRGEGVFAPDTRFLYTALAGGWLLVAFIGAVVLRAFDDLRLWRYLSAGMLISDIVVCYSTAHAVGGWAAWADFSSWGMETWAVFLTTAVPPFIRLMVILGVGVKREI